MCPNDSKRRHDLLVVPKFLHQWLKLVPHDLAHLATKTSSFDLQKNTATVNKSTPLI
jgi:hypothetical protein